MNKAMQINAPESRAFFDELRSGFAFVAAHADHVRIDETALTRAVQDLPDQPPANVFDPEHHYLSQDREAAASYVMLLDALNFGSGFKPFLVAEGWELIDGSIYYTQSKRLKDTFAQESLGVAKLSGWTVDDIAAIFALPQGPNARAWAELAVRSAHQLAHMIAEHYQGSFSRFVEAAGGSVFPLVSTLAHLSCYDDKASYKGRLVGFYKRAQITAMDLHLAWRQYDEVLFSDTDELTIFADNAVPASLRALGVLDISPELAARIDRQELLPAGSAEEVELRACAAHAVELLAAAKHMRVADIDHILWHQSAEGRLKGVPSHRTKTLFY